MQEKLFLLFFGGIWGVRCASSLTFSLIPILSLNPYLVVSLTNHLLWVSLGGSLVSCLARLSSTPDDLSESWVVLESNNLRLFRFLP